MEWPAWLVAAVEWVRPAAETIAFWRGYEGPMQTLLVYAIGIAVYTIFVFGFLQNIAKRDAFAFERKKGVKGHALRGVQTGLVFPLMSFVYFSVLALSLFVLAKSQSTVQILLLSMSVVVGVRVSTFVKESSAADVAKLLPLSLLGILIVDPSYTSLDLTWARIGEVPSLVPVLIRFFVLFIALEGILRIGHAVFLRVHAHVPKRGSRAKHVKKSELIEAAGKPTPVTMVDMQAER